MQAASERQAGQTSLLDENATAAASHIRQPLLHLANHITR